MSVGTTTARHPGAERPTNAEPPTEPPDDPALAAADPQAARIEAGVWAALEEVVDPELDEPLTDLGFVSEVTAGAAGDVLVRLRLPTYFCAPNFAFLMVADAFDAARAVPGVSAVEVRLDDHFASDEINAGVRAEAGFGAAFPGLAEGELEELRVTFWRKAHAAEQDRVARHLAQQGVSLQEMAVLRLGDREPEEVDALRRRRRRLGLPTADDAPLLVGENGAAFALDDLPLQLRLARATRVSIEGNAGLCRSLLGVRYGPGDTDTDTDTHIDTDTAQATYG